MAANGLKGAIAANLEWIRGVRLADRIEWVWLAVPAALSVIVLAACLALTQTSPVYSLIGAAAHLCFVICLYFSVPRNWLPPLSLLVFLSEINLLIYIWNAAPKLGVVLLSYGLFAAIGAAVSVAAYRRALNALTRLKPASSKEDFRWLVTAAPLSIRRKARRIVSNMVEPKQD
jgi:hypothetical protein